MGSGASTSYRGSYEPHPGYRPGPPKYPRKADGWDLKTWTEGVAETEYLRLRAEAPAPSPEPEPDIRTLSRETPSLGSTQSTTTQSTEASETLTPTEAKEMDTLWGGYPTWALFAGTKVDPVVFRKKQEQRAMERRGDFSKYGKAVEQEDRPKSRAKTPGRSPRGPSPRGRSPRQTGFRPASVA